MVKRRNKPNTSEVTAGQMEVTKILPLRLVYLLQSRKCLGLACRVFT